MIAHNTDFDLDSFYEYGYQGKSMVAARAPFAMSQDGAGLNGENFIGARARLSGRSVRIRSIWRQIGGPIAKGEPIGVEVEDWPDEQNGANGPGLEAKSPAAS
jgi:hypothetical protein